MADRFFVTVYAPGEQELRALGAYDLDLFQATARLSETGEASIEGLMTLADVARLVADGFRVVVEDPMEARVRARGGEVRSDDWLRALRRD